MPSPPGSSRTPRHAVAVALSGVLLALATPSNAQAQSPVTATAEVNVLSQYFFAGIPFATGEVSQATFTMATPGGFTFSGFAVYDYDRKEITEVDFWGDYYTQLVPTVGLFVGAALYSFDLVTNWESTPEVYGGLVLTAPLNPTLYVAHDFDLGEGTHATVTLSESAGLDQGGATVNVTGNLDYNSDYYLDFSGFGYADLGASLSIPAGPVTLAPSLTFLFALDDDFQALAEIDDVEEVIGLSASMTF